MNFYYREEISPIRSVMSWVVDIVVVLAFAWFCLHAFGGQIVIAGQSMMPLLNPDDVVLVNRLSYDFGKPKRLDVVVFERGDNKTNVKRVIGLPGEEILIQGGYVYIDGERLEAGAREYGHSNRRELAYLAVHSVLHLLGYDHLDEGPMKAQMRGREEAIMSGLGLER